MKAFSYKNKLYAITETRGSFYYGKDYSGKVGCIEIANAEVVEIDKLPKPKYYRKPSQKSAPVKVDPIQTWKKIALSVNNKWDNNSTWHLAEDYFGRMSSKGSEFIESLLNSMFKLGRLSEKQAYYLAKFGVETGQLK